MTGSIRISSTICWNTGTTASGTFRILRRRRCIFRRAERWDIPTRLILYAPFYLAVRPFLDPFQAHNATLFLVLLCGSLCLYAILRRFAGLRFAEALLLTVFFFSSRNVINGGTGVWSQRASVFLIPPILLLGFASVQMPERSLRLGLAGLSGLLLSLLFTQDFYTAQLGLLVVTLVAAGALLITWRPATHGPSSWWLIVAGVCFVWAIAIALHPVERTTIGPLRFSATDPTRPLLIALFDRRLVFPLARSQKRTSRFNLEEGKAISAGYRGRSVDGRRSLSVDLRRCVPRAFDVPRRTPDELAAPL